MEWLLDPHAWLALATLTALEIVLGVDNIIFISVLCGRLPEHQRAKARTIGLVLAMGTNRGRRCFETVNRSSSNPCRID